MKCRARMIDGSWVTFERHVRDVVERDAYRAITGTTDWPYGLLLSVLITEFVGEGFHALAVTKWGGNYGSLEEASSWRTRDELLILERSGVDTATVEYWQEGNWQAHQHMMFSDGSPDQHKRWQMDGNWVPLFPPVLREEPETIAPGSLSYMSVGEVEGLRKMLNAERRVTVELKRRLEAGGEPTFDMVAAGAAKLHDVLQDVAISRGEVMPRDGYGEAIRAIWRAMEKTR